LNKTYTDVNADVHAYADKWSTKYYISI